MLLDPCKKKMKFASNDQKEFAKVSLNEVYELMKNNTNIQQESSGPKPKKRKYQQKHEFIQRVYFQMMNLMIILKMKMKLKDI